MTAPHPEPTAEQIERACVAYATFEDPIRLFWWEFLCEFRPQEADAYRTRMAAALVASRTIPEEGTMDADTLQPAKPPIDKEEFCRRFVAYMVGQAGFDRFDCGELVEDYAKNTAPTYFDEADQSEDGPGACADADMSCWGEN